MNLLEKIKLDQVQARKDRNELKSNLLTTLYSEASMIGKNANRETADNETISMIKKFVKNNREFVKVANSQPLLQTLDSEYEILNGYLPKQLSDEEITTQINTLLFSNLGECMKFFKENHSGTYDGNTVKVLYERHRNML